MLRRRNTVAVGLARRRAARTKHYGVLVPWANQVVETELPMWAAGQAIWHYARLAPPGGGTALTGDFLTGLVEAMPSGLYQLSHLPLERVYLACTSAGFTQQKTIKEATARASVDVVTAFDAITTTLRWFGLRTLALATPYPEEVIATEVTAFEALGFTVAAAASLGLDDGYADLTTSQIIGLVRGIDARALARADAVVLSCTGWPTRTALAQLRHKLGCPMISSNLAICMHALRVVP